MPKKRLLVTDADPQVRDSLSEAFGSQYDVLATPSIEAAIREATINQPSCILLDTGMPQMGASMLCKILRSMPETETIPVVLTGYQPRNVCREAVKHMEPFDYIEKPFSIDQVSEVVKRAIERPPKERRRSQRLLLRIPYVIEGKDAYDQDLKARGMTEVVSQHGLLVKLPSRIPVGQEVEILQAAKKDPNRITGLSRARVIWNDKEGVHGPYWHGLEFLTPSPDWASE